MNEHFTLFYVVQVGVVMYFQAVLAQQHLGMHIAHHVEEPHH